MGEASKDMNFATILLFLVAIATCTSPSSALRDLASGTSTEFIRTSCNKTTYPLLCFRSLSSFAAAIQTSPKLLASTALDVTLENACSASAMMANLSRSQGLKPREAAAMQDCVELLSDTVDELRRSIAEMKDPKGHDFEMMISDVQTWVSAALTNEDTCSDGFAGKEMNGKVKTAVRARIVTLSHLTSNALALINAYASLHG
ncbi:21 kDa protein-like [Rhodamnia argentea]|uniref:21 kDa protein-like n=1 Tax=Rhodamnia argentea TaxID=178133 RepID=A0A8B8PDZ2_9MYRT|nr:21 kDa protein-like [Rhodamnia argentea]